jgi:hypothetical protein
MYFPRRLLNKKQKGLPLAAFLGSHPCPATERMRLTRALILRAALRFEVARNRVAIFILKTSRQMAEYAVCLLRL